MIGAIGSTEEIRAQVQETPDIVTIDARGKIVHRREPRPEAQLV